MDAIEAPVTADGERQVPLRVLLAERRPSARSELADQLEELGHEVLARVTCSQGALDYAGLLRPDAVLMAAELEDGPAVMTALKLTRALPGTAAVVFTNHPGARDPSTRPNWGVVTLIHAEAEPAQLDAELRRAVAMARDVAANETSSRRLALVSSAPPVVPPEMEAPADKTPVPSEPVAVVEAVEVVEPVAVVAAVEVVAAAVVDVSVPAPSAASVNVLYMSEQPSLALTDEDLFGIGPFVDTSETMPSPVDYSVPALQPSTDLAGASDMDDEAVVGLAAECLLERTGLSRSDAMRMMEQEAVDTGQPLIDVARAVLGQEAPTMVG